MNSSINSNLEKLFNSNEIKILKNNLIITTNNILQVFDSDTGSTKFKIPINSQVSPVVNNDYIFTITKNNYLISVQISTGKIIYSYEINQLISNYLKSKKKEINIKLIRLINSQVYVFLDNAFVVKLSLDGVIKDIFKLPKKMDSNPIFIENSLIYLNNKNKIVILN